MKKNIEGLFFLDDNNRFDDKSPIGFYPNIYMGFNNDMYNYYRHDNIEHWDDFELWLMGEDKEFLTNEFGLADPFYFKYLLKYQKTHNIYIMKLNNSDTIKKYENFTFIGLDYGILEISDFDSFFAYSMLANDIGRAHVFDRFIDKLNKYYLFSRMEDAIDFEKTRTHFFFNYNKRGTIESAFEPEKANIFQIHLYNPDYLRVEEIMKKILTNWYY